MPSFQDVDAVFRRDLLLEDSHELAVILAVVLSHYAPGDPTWVVFIGPSAGGKTEYFNSLSGVESVCQIDTLSSKTFLSGFESSKHQSSLLLRHPNPILIISDLGTVMSENKDEQKKIVGQLRRIYDGKYDKTTGMGKDLKWEGKATLLAGSTSAADDMLGRVVHSHLGERFLTYRMRRDNRLALAEASLKGTTTKEEARSRRRAIVGQFIKERYQKAYNCPIPSVVYNALPPLSDFVARARSHVERDGFTHEIIGVPMPEVGSRIVAQLARLGQCIPLVDSTLPLYQILRKIALDSIPPIRMAIIQTLQDGEKSTTEVAVRTCLPKTTAVRALEDLALLGVVLRTSGNGYLDGADRWALVDRLAL